MAAKKVREQWSRNLYQFFLWTFIVAFGIVGAVQVALHGTGTRSSAPMSGWKKMVVSWLSDMEMQGHGDVARWIVVAIFGFAALYAFVCDIRFIRHITPGLTRLGRSIKKQAVHRESFRELCSQIDQDMEGGYREFGTGVYVSSSWILEEEAMRLTRIRKITCKSGFGKNGLVLEDVDGNCMNIDFIFKEPTREALDFLQEKLPGAEILGGEDFMEKKKGRMNMEEKKLMSWHVPKTSQEAEELGERAGQGDASAQREYGKCLLFGKGVPADKDKAFGWLNKAADQSDEIAKMYVGHCYLYGIGTKKDEDKGYAMLDEALQYNYPEESSSQPLAEYSQFQEEDLCQLFWDLGDSLENGLGPYINYNVAVYYFEMLEDWGHPEGGERMTHFKKGMFGKWKKI